MAPFYKKEISGKKLFKIYLLLLMFLFRAVLLINMVKLWKYFVN